LEEVVEEQQQQMPWTARRFDAKEHCYVSDCRVEHHKDLHTEVRSWRMLACLELFDRTDLEDAQPNGAAMAGEELKNMDVGVVAHHFDSVP
jgi:hypothetical protein